MFSGKAASLMCGQRINDEITLEEDITTGLGVLQSHLDGMLDRVERNSVTLKRLQRFETSLLSLSSLTEMIDFILGQGRALFDLDVISLCLIDTKAEIAGYLEFDNFDHQGREDLLLINDEGFLQDGFDLSFKPVLGRYHDDNWGHIFRNSLKKPASVVIAPLMRRGRCLGSLNLGSYEESRFSTNMATDFVEHIASVIGICLENNLNFEIMRRTSLVDPLTGVNNRRFLEQRIDEELERSRRSRMPMSCLFLDIDFFKRINDAFGHQAGDYVLTQVSGVIKRQLRSNDVLSRYGGEEFVALLSQSDEKCAGEIAERIRSAIEALRIEYGGQYIPVTISIGAATYQFDDSNKQPVTVIAGQLIRAADDALYQAKRNGRNRIGNGGLLSIANCA